MKIKKIIKKLNGNKIYVILVVILFFVSLQFQEKKAPQEIQNLDTFIPHGYVLIPIEIVNLETVDEILGAYGIVNLYTFSSYTKKPSKLIVKNIRIVRSPKRSEAFAVLSPEKRAKSILSYPQPFYVAVKNPEAKDTSFEVKKKKRHIFVDTEN